MDHFELTRKLVEIESITGNEARIGEFLESLLGEMAAGHQGQVERMPVEPGRFNVLACFGEPVVTLSTHIDTVPPYLPFRDDGEYLWGRGACDTKGIIASMVTAAGKLLERGRRGIALLFVVGEEKNSAGAFEAARRPRGSRYLINGEPTENKLALGSKGALRYEITATGRMAHSAYPQLGESAIDKLLDSLEAIRRIPLPVHPVLGPGTLNIGTLNGGRAPNVVADSAMAEIMIRLVEDGEPLARAVEAAAAGRAEARRVLMVPPVYLRAVEGFETTVVAYTTDIPAFAGSWGEPLLLGPGTIHVAHTSEERVLKRELTEAVEIYQALVDRLLRER